MIIWEIVGISNNYVLLEESSYKLDDASYKLDDVTGTQGVGAGISQPWLLTPFLVQCITLVNAKQCGASLEEVPAIVAHTHALALVQTARELVARIQTDQTQKTRAFSMSRQCVLCVCAHALARVKSAVCSWGVPSDSSPFNCIPDYSHEQPLLPWTLINEACVPQEVENPA